jgi:hypothetical protein
MTADMRGRPSWGVLNPEQKAVVRKFIQGRRIRDYGCGNLHLTQQLLELGARHVEGVDKARAKVPPQLKDRLTVLHSAFSDCPPSVRTAFVSWPDNHDTGIHIPLNYATRIIYLGKNTDSTMCGTPRLWRQLCRRRVLAHVPAKENDLIVYGEAKLVNRRRLPEECAGIKKDRVYSYEELHRPKARLGRTLSTNTSIFEYLLEAIYG